MKENDLSVIEIYVCVAFMIHIIDFIKRREQVPVPSLQFLLLNRLSKLLPTRHTLKLHSLSSACGAVWIWDVALEPSDQMPSSVDWRWKYSKGNRFALDWCGANDVNLNKYIFTCTSKGLCYRRKCVKKEVSCLPFCSCSVLQQKILLHSLSQGLSKCYFLFNLSYKPFF